MYVMTAAMSSLLITPFQAGMMPLYVLPFTCTLPVKPFLTI